MVFVGNKINEIESRQSRAVRVHHEGGRGTSECTRRWPPKASPACDLQRRHLKPACQARYLGFVVHSGACDRASPLEPRPKRKLPPPRPKVDENRRGELLEALCKVILQAQRNSSALLHEVLINLRRIHELRRRMRTIVQKLCGTPGR